MDQKRRAAALIPAAMACIVMGLLLPRASAGPVFGLTARWWSGFLLGFGVAIAIFAVVKVGKLRRR